MNALSERNVTTSETPVPSGMADDYRRMKRLSDELLDAELSETLELTARHFFKLAAIVRLKEERGHDLSEIPMIGYLRQIAYGHLLPDVVAHYAGDKPFIVRALAKLPVVDQAKAIKEGVEIGVVRSGGRFDRVRVALKDLQPEQAKAVFTPTGMLSAEQQVSRYRFAKPAAVREERPEQAPYTIERGRLVVRRPVTLSKRELLRIIDSL